MELLSFWICVAGAAMTALIVCLAALDWADPDAAGFAPEAVQRREEVPAETWLHWTTMRNR